MAKDYYETQLFEYMKENGIPGTIDNVSKIEEDDLPEQAQLELNYLCSVCSGRKTITQAGGDFGIAEYDDGRLIYALHTSNDCSKCEVHALLDTYATYEGCSVEEYGDMQAIVTGGECVAIWDKDALKREQESA